MLRVRSGAIAALLAAFSFANACSRSQTPIPSGTGDATSSGGESSGSALADGAPSSEPAPSADATTAPALSASASSVPTSSASAAPSTPGAPPGKVADKSKPALAPTSPPASAGAAGDNGTIVAVAVGGSCAFSVNGASKGAGASLKLSVKPGTYSVTCAPSSGPSKSKSVTVIRGGTAMAMFKL